ncbi:Biotin carboxyl carrier protein of acetyl-CoA carboxylase 1, chloroplastic [Musa troglodytarum]|uniref:Biotin carboxyl carrier protein of acetyl-CoA carboxylase n=1 Tax=Musa troglodytarum TaxID=320322 RepID=A0A9E7JAP9_9LILI|nr:Biotin carboxyl carrier protein of acetyl-CoA carboxylase 1, chloroplastic [Musa troglodytarum]
MASISVPCPKCSVIARNWATKRSPLASFPNAPPSSVSGSAWLPSSKDSTSRHYPVLNAQFQEVTVETTSNSSPIAWTKSETLPIKIKDAGAVKESGGQNEATDSTISTFMAEVSGLVKLVDSKDITELHLKKDGCELLIKKKEALPEPPVAAASPVIMHYPQAMLPPQPTQANPVATASAPALAPSTAAGSKSSIPPLKCPMAGTFYRCPAPGEPPFVKVGDKVQKGQVVCIIEAMKLMNEIESDQSGTVVEIVAEDGKPVSVDSPLLVIQA